MVRYHRQADTTPVPCAESCQALSAYDYLILTPLNPASPLAFLIFQAATLVSIFSVDYSVPIRSQGFRMRRYFDHIDLRVHSLAESRPFYDQLLPALGFTKDAKIESWVQYEAPGTDGAPEFFGLTESRRHVANECRFAFWADNPAEVDRLAAIAIRAGARNVEGPLYEEPGYYAIFFEDPSGNRLEICYREPAEIRPAVS